MSDIKQFKPVVDVKKVCVIGAGQFGFALSYLISKVNPHLPIAQFDVSKEMIKHLLQTRQHLYFHKGVKLPSTVHPTLDIKTAVQNAQIVILSVPGKYLRGALKNVLPYVQNDVIFLSVAKSLEPVTNLAMGDVIEEEIKKFNSPHKMYVAAMAGGMLAEEVTRQAPIAADVGCEHLGAAQQIVDLLQSPGFKLAPHTDLLGVEMAGCLKNVTAIGAGIIDGMQFETSTKAAYISLAAKQMRTLALALGAESTTFDLGSQAWLGDLLTTCFGNGRNRLFGSYIGGGQSVETALKTLNDQHKISEGYLSTKGFAQLAVEKGLDLSVLKNMNAVLFEGMPAREAVLNFFAPESKL